MLVICALFNQFFITIMATGANSVLEPENFPDKLPPSKIKLSLDTVLKFKETEADRKLYRNVQKLLNQVKTNINGGNVLRTETKDNDPVTFTDFIINVIEIIQQYDDKDLEHFFSVLNNEIRKYHYRGCKFYELIDIVGLRKFIAKKLDGIKNKPADFLRKTLKDIAVHLQEESVDEKKRDFYDLINSLYKDDSVFEFKKFINNINDYRLKKNNKNDLIKIIREGVRAIIFDHYTDLNHNTRTEFRTKIGSFWNYFLGVSSSLLSMLEISLVESTADGVKNTVLNNKATKKSKHVHRKVKTEEPERTTLDSLTMRQMYVEKNLDLKYDPYAYDNFSTIAKTKGKKSKTTPQKEKGDAIYKNGLKIWQDTRDFLRNHHDRLEVVTMRPYEYSTSVPRNFRYEIFLRNAKTGYKEPELHLKKPEHQIKMPNDVAEPKFHIKITVTPPTFVWKKMYQDASEITLSVFHGTPMKRSKTLEKNSTHKSSKSTSHKTSKGKSKTKPKDKKFGFFRRKFDMSNSSLVMNRLLQLETDLNAVKTQIKNDSDIIKDLNNMVQDKETDEDVSKLTKENESFLTNNVEKPKNKKTKEVVIDLKINLDDFKKLIDFTHDGKGKDVTRQIKLNYLDKPNDNDEDEEQKKSDKIYKAYGNNWSTAQYSNIDHKESNKRKKRFKINKKYNDDSTENTYRPGKHRYADTRIEKNKFNNDEQSDYEHSHRNKNKNSYYSKSYTFKKDISNQDYIDDAEVLERYQVKSNRIQKKENIKKYNNREWNGPVKHKIENSDFHSLMQSFKYNDKTSYKEDLLSRTEKTEEFVPFTRMYKFVPRFTMLKEDKFPQYNKNIDVSQSNMYKKQTNEQYKQMEEKEKVNNLYNVKSKYNTNKPQKKSIYKSEDNDEDAKDNSNDDLIDTENKNYLDDEGLSLEINMSKEKKPNVETLKSPEEKYLKEETENANTTADFKTTKTVESNEKYTNDKTSKENALPKILPDINIDGYTNKQTDNDTYTVQEAAILDANVNQYRNQDLRNEYKSNIENLGSTEEKMNPEVTTASASLIITEDNSLKTLTKRTISPKTNATTIDTLHIDILSVNKTFLYRSNFKGRRKMESLSPLKMNENHKENIDSDSSSIMNRTLRALRSQRKKLKQKMTNVN